MEKYIFNGLWKYWMKRKLEKVIYIDPIGISIYEMKDILMDCNPKQIDS